MMALKVFCFVLLACTLARAAPTTEPENIEHISTEDDLASELTTIAPELQDISELTEYEKQEMMITYQILKEEGLAMHEQIHMLDQLSPEQDLKSNARTPAPKSQETAEVTEYQKDSPIYSSPSPPIDDQFEINSS